ncbi:S8 family serine peptidase [Romboutsia sp. CE17]|uniref:S8 family peptidase n=1 Tax=Romboutsia sp. CE17 TaxID=2724150 RepID=UPI001442DD87|nr:S8 family serine peptidase [Romboutsia sp. CE17]QJA07651.1 S8 family serine peptidase [Romboutsia sp. CE17]
MKKIFISLKELLYNYRKSISMVLFLIIVGLVYSGYSTIFSDQIIEEQWNSRYMNYNKLHKISTGESQTIALIDSGISKFQDVKENIDLTKSKSSYDTNGHGTTMYSLIKGYSNKITGVSPDSKIISIKVMNSDESINPETVKNAIEIAIEKNVDIISLSLGSTKENRGIADKINEATSKGITVISSAGDYEQDFLLFPASLDNVISVGSIAANGRVSDYTNAPDETTINAPGEEILMVENNEKIIEANGSSEATAIITGYVSLLKDKSLKEGKQLTTSEIQKLLLKIKESDITYAEVLKNI